MISNPYIESYSNKEVPFKYRGRLYTFSLSHGLFSSAGIDAGSAFLLKVFSNYLDNAKFSIVPAPAELSEELPVKILDSGCGVGVLGICAVGALSDLISKGGAEKAGCHGFLVRSQDRDELARLFTEYNAAVNGFTAECNTNEKSLEARTEPLLAGPSPWDLILCNIPAKAGLPVLEDFVRRSAGLLKKDGKVFLVAVNTLADFFRSIITEAASIMAEETGKEHTVFVYAKQAVPGVNGDNTKKTHNSSSIQDSPVVINDNFPANYPFYIRNSSEYEMEGISYHMDTVYGAPDFDSPNGAVQAAARLALKIDLSLKLEEAIQKDDSSENTATGKAGLLIHDAGQGHFALWLSYYLGQELSAANQLYVKKLHFAARRQMVLSGRNIVALAAARENLNRNFPDTTLTIIPSADIFLDRERLTAGLAAAFANNRENCYNLIGFFPETVPETDRRETSWEALSFLSAPGGIVITGLNSMEAERFDRKKPRGFTRLADIKRKGFRAAAYRRS